MVAVIKCDLCGKTEPMEMVFRKDHDFCTDCADKIYKIKTDVQTELGQMYQERYKTLSIKDPAILEFVQFMYEHHGETFKLQYGEIAWDLLKRAAE